MKLKFTVLILFSWLNLFSQPKLDSLRRTMWQFHSYVGNGQVVVIDKDDFKYTLKFGGKKFEGLATYKYWGRYKINRNNEIVVRRVFVPRAAAPEATDSKEFEWRFFYERNLGRGLPIYYEIRNGYLKLHVNTDKYIMVFKSLP